MAKMNPFANMPPKGKKGGKPVPPKGKKGGSKGACKPC